MKLTRPTILLLFTTAVTTCTGIAPVTASELSQEQNKATVVLSIR